MNFKEGVLKALILVHGNAPTMIYASQGTQVSVDAPHSVGVKENKKEVGRNDGKSKCSLKIKGISREG